MLKNIWNLYYDGLRTLPRWARILCVIVLVKLLIMFLIIRLCFMPDYLNSRYTTDTEKSEHVLNALIHKSE